MGVRDLQDFLEADCQSACKAVDLLKIARTYQAKRRGKNPGRLRLIVDAESCLDRLYGGFYSDWACGGQWNRMTSFLAVLIQACQSTNMELVVFFNGAAETERLSEWAEQMVADKKKVASVLKHIHHKATPPPKVWWIPPVCLRQCLRMVLRQMGVSVACSMDDHHQEVIAYCRENNFHGLVAQDAEYAIFDPPRYFSSHNLKLTYRQALETKEYVMDEVAQHWDLNPKRFCILAALLGNHILTENDLKFFYDSITTPANKSQADRIKAVVGYVRAIKSENDLDDIAKDVFSSVRLGKTPPSDVAVNKFKKSIQYYMNGTQDGFLNYKPKGIVSTSSKQPGSYPGKPEKADKGNKTGSKVAAGGKEDSSKVKKEAVKSEQEASTDVPEKVMVNGDQEKHEEEEDKDKDKQVGDKDEQNGEKDEQEVDKDEKNKDKDEQEEVKDEQVVDKDEQDVDKDEQVVDKDEQDAVTVEEDEDKDEQDEDQDEELKDLKADSVYTERESGYANPDSMMTPAIVIDPPSSSQSSLDKDLSDGISNLVLDDPESEEMKDDEEEEEVKDEEATEEKSTEDENKSEEAKSSENNSEEAKSTESGKEEAESTDSKDGTSLDAKDAAKKGDTVEQGTKTEEVKVPSLSSASSSSSSTPAQKGSPAPEGGNKTTTQKSKGCQNRQNAEGKMPQVAPEIVRIASERHQKGLMSPWVYQILSQGEIKLGVTMEDESSRELPTAVELYRPIRQSIYAILFDMSKRRPTTGKPNSNGANKEVIIKEWTLPRGSSVPRVDQVRARPLEWKVPTLRRLWLGQAIEDKNRRLRALLTCLRSDTPRMLNTSYVPQHLLIMACVLRYMVLNKDVRVLRKHELDAFLCASVSPLLHDVDTMQEMKLPMITSRGVQLAALFMRGVEAAIFANDACGAPIPWSMCCPWHFFDGKLFHFKLLKANNNTALLDICDGHMDQMMRVERLRVAILDGIPPDALFARPSLPVMQQQQPQYGGGPFYHPANNINFRPAGASPLMMGGGPPMDRGGRGRGLLGRSPVDSRGGQLQIAGVVVGNWGANVQANQARPGHRAGNVAPPHVTAVGPRRGGGVMRGRINNGRGLMRGGATAMPQRPGSAGRGYNTKSQNGMQRSNITAVKSGIRNSTPPMRGGGSTGSSPAAMRGKARIRGPAGYNPGKVIVEQRARVAGPGRGRGMTVENPMDSSVVSVSQLMKPTNRTEKGQGDDRDFGQFMDAEPVKHAEVKVNLDRDDEPGMGEESTL